MRIVKGKWAGRHFSVTKLPAYVRPTSNYAKEGILNVLCHNYGIQGKAVLDLFSGTGNMGLEFLSAEAASVDMVERSQTMCRHIRQSLVAFDLGEQRATLHAQEVFSFLNQTSFQAFDLIFADPPFEKNYAQQMLHLLRERSWMVPSGGVLVYECSSRRSDAEMHLPSWNYARKLSYGDTSFYIYEG